MAYSASDIARILNNPKPVQPSNIERLLLDSRKILSPPTSLFFAIKGPRRDGHHFIGELYRKGVRNFVISEKIEELDYPEANFFLVKNTIEALQHLASYHRSQFSLPVMGITGSNGKTIVKEWLFQLLEHDYSIVRSPKSYNSQIGVPMSVWQINAGHSLGIFEAGISQRGEMENLEKVIQPSFGILTNIGEAHSEGFRDKKEKLFEKLALFSNCERVICKGDDPLIRQVFSEKEIKSFTWGTNNENDLRVMAVKRSMTKSHIDLRWHENDFAIDIPFTDDAAIENAITCCSTMLYLGKSPALIRERMEHLQPVNMRLELKNGINQCVIINDSYSADLSSLEIALNFFDQQKSSRRTVILSDFLQSGVAGNLLYGAIKESLEKHKVTRIIGIGPVISRQLKIGEGISTEFYDNTGEFLQQLRTSQFRDEIILVKGARIFGFEKIVHALEQKAHQTLLEINLNAIAHNLAAYQKKLKPSTRVMAMVKAFAYGSGGAEIAGILQFHKLDYLGVAYTDEGVELRRAGISLPTMVMNPDESSFEAIIENNLEPEIYSSELLHSFINFLVREGIQDYPVHIEIETGMNRLGFEIIDIEDLARDILSTNTIKVVSVFSHLAASEDPAQDGFTKEQFGKFQFASDLLSAKLGYTFLRHIANSAAIIRYPEMQSDMVRLGIGLYGIDPSSSEELSLLPVATLKSTIAQLKFLKAGESVSYNRKGIVDRNSVIATVRIGYADGYPRRLGYGVGKMLVKGRLASVIGSVCMDMTMIDITDIEGVKEGDEVLIFGEGLSIEKVARLAETIPYEIMTGISQRVKRVYYQE